MRRLVFVFLDGFGLAEPGCDNPISLYDWPCLQRILGAAPVAGHDVATEDRLLRPIDACLGVAGLPQSATGQVALFTGVNAPALLGYHLEAYPNRRLREIIKEDNLLKRVAGSGLRATFANAYTPEYFEMARQRKRRHSATTLCVMAAGLRFRMVQDLVAGRAVYCDITNSYLRQRQGYEHLPLVEPAEAGARLARLALDHHLVLFESFLTDRIGHKRDRVEALHLMPVLDCFLASCARALPEHYSLVVVSDHGNVEDLTTSTHTRNPVPLIVIGPAAPVFSEVESITGVAEAVYRTLGIVAVKHSA